METSVMWRWLVMTAVAAAGILAGQSWGQGRTEGVVPKPRIEPLVIPKVAHENVICFALYTVSRGTLKLTAQLYPLEPQEDRVVRLEIQEGDAWKEIARAQVIERGWTAPFRVEKWDASRTVAYRLCHGKGAFYTGTIRKDPVEKQTLVVAAFTGNGNNDRGPRPDIIRNIKIQDPDLLFFSGDQVYDEGEEKHYPAWLLFGRQFGEIIKDRPTITIPDDHDIGQGNLWGAGGSKRARTQAGDEGGYFWDPEFVKEVERGQTSHLPDAHEPMTLPIGVGVYYCAFTWGGVSFAVIEDRKFKSAPRGLVPRQGPRPDQIDDPKYDRKSVDVPGAALLGEKQEKFLAEWGQDWSGAEMKAVLSQTIFANAAHVHGKLGRRLLADLDSNGWPQSGRNRALDLMRKCFALHIAGDQHLASVIHHGITEYEDAGWSFCVPSIVNFYNRWWWPLEPSKRPVSSEMEMTGDFEDGFGNKITMYTYANPRPDNARAAGYGIVRFDKTSRKMTLECWPREVDVTDPKARQYRGWPMVIDQMDNYGRKPAGYLPTIRLIGARDAVVQVVDEADGKPVYTLRMKGDTFRPKVFKEGSYTLKVGEGEARKVFKGVKIGEGVLEAGF